MRQSCFASARPRRRTRLETTRPSKLGKLLQCQPTLGARSLVLLPSLETASTLHECCDVTESRERRGCAHRVSTAPKITPRTVVTRHVRMRGCHCRRSHHLTGGAHLQVNVPRFACSSLRTFPPSPTSLTPPGALPLAATPTPSSPPRDHLRMGPPHTSFGSVEASCRSPHRFPRR